MAKVLPKKSKIILLTFLLIFTVLMAACGPAEQAGDTGGDDTSSDSSGTDDTAADDGAADDGAADDGAADDGVADEKSSITILIPDNPAGFNGLTTSTGYEQALGELLMLSMAETDPNGNLIPELATVIPTLENGMVTFDEETWSMTVTWIIRQDVFWADGEQVTVDDVIFTHNVIAEQAWADGVDYTETIEKIDDFTMKVIFWEGSIYPNYALQFGGEDYFIYPEHYCDPEQGFYEWDCDKQPLSNGPYILTEWVDNDHLTFERNENYYEPGKPAIDQVIVRILPEQSVRREIMLQGDADVHYWPGDTNSEFYKESDLVDWVIAPTERWVMRLFPNMMERGSLDTPHPFLSDVTVRQAIRRAIDVDTIINEMFFGNGSPVWTEFFREPYVCEVERPPYDPVAAAAMLEGAGWIVIFRPKM